MLPHHLRFNIFKILIKHILKQIPSIVTIVKYENLISNQINVNSGVLQVDHTFHHIYSLILLRYIKGNHSWHENI